MKPAPIYLDNNATTRIDPEVAESLAHAFAQGYVNPSSQHALGRRSRAALEQAKEQILADLGAKTEGFASDEFLLTSGGTESNNLAIFGMVKPQPGKVIVSSIEHPSVSAATDLLRMRGYDVQTIKAQQNGTIDLDYFRALLTPETQLVSVMLANNETGVLQPVAEIAEKCREIGVKTHCDAIQAIGKIPVSFRDLGVDAMTITAHKLHGPRGVGGLILRHGVQLSPQLHGGGQQLAKRPGTEPVELGIAMAKAMRLSLQSAEKYANLAEMRTEMEAELHQIDPSAVIHGAEVGRLPHTISVSFPGIDRQALVMALDLAGVCISTGSACASGSSERSPVLIAMGLENDQIESAVRISLGRDTTRDEVAEGLRRISNCINNLR
ncbi:cysteine desulfurase [Blastopirellula sp. JC732]|uniref:cysteine desulfurase n=1 Tax=Blastopirellula sediminis TaxID=2894196 RepID=A0A9X1MQW5_9BACT|nr:cysteine desulfurase family protein [Blastopirellula sediminis]MCC9606759.1 cysteine desulfurase [Blastopirellula sediminis]MCC9629944.1 cysteine desulfurase [Blastopirellula sediminis]